jgi:hypothetical protein
MKVAIQRISLPSLGKMGCLLGAVAAFLPSLLCGLLVIVLAGVVLEWLGGWQDLSISFLGQELVSLDLVQFFGLEELTGYLQGLTAVSIWVLLLAALVMALVAGAALAVIIILVGLAYNLLASATGGLVVEMDTVARMGAGSTAPNRTERS